MGIVRPARWFALAFATGATIVAFPACDDPLDDSTCGDGWCDGAPGCELEDDPSAAHCERHSDTYCQADCGCYEDDDFCRCGKDDCLDTSCCDFDAGECYCGDGCCEEFEDCEEDCGFDCNDGVCSGAPELNHDCGCDCSCGPGYCDPRCDELTCPEGCDPCFSATCGDDTCDVDCGETVESCAEDCGPQCDHSPCDGGEALDARCGICEAAVCANVALCCDVVWGATCLAEVQTACPGLCPTE